jgi:Zn-finger nucleic acid-binding protein
MSSSAGVLRCPSCGAPASPDATRCEYCRATLATIGCPTCFGLLFKGAAFCHHCGSARSRADAGPAHEIACPACRGHMQWTRVGDTDLLECKDCSGTWIEAATFERLCSDRTSHGALLHRDAAPPPAGTPQPVRYRKCPRCTKVMNRVNFGRISGAIVDVCKGHGTFLDRGELHQIVRFVSEGGMDRARKAEIATLKEEQDRLRGMQRDLARMQREHNSVPPTHSTRWESSALGEILKALLGTS